MTRTGIHNYVRKMLGWYKGDGLYGDGEVFHFDYYNSFVIQPMLLDIMNCFKDMEREMLPVVLAAFKTVCSDFGENDFSGGAYPIVGVPYATVWRISDFIADVPVPQSSRGTYPCAGALCPDCGDETDY